MTRILVVDDSPDSALSMSKMLVLKGHQTQIADSGLVALDAWVHFAPDFIFLDIRMPGLNGYDTAVRLRQTGCLAVLVAVTGMQEDRPELNAAGFDHYLVKPVDLVLLDSLLSKPLRIIPNQ